MSAESPQPRSFRFSVDDTRRLAALVRRLGVSPIQALRLAMHALETGGIRPAVVRHHHFFSPRCRDEMHGRFDAIECPAGSFNVLNVGTGELIPCLDFEQARTVAKDRAKRWRPTKPKRRS